MSDAGTTPPHAPVSPFRDRLQQLCAGREPVRRDINAEVERQSILGDGLAAANGFEVNTRAELAIRPLHERLELMTLEQLALLREVISSRNGPDAG